MSYEFTGRARLEIAMGRAIRRDAKREKIDAWHAKKHKHFFQSDNCRRVQEENKRLGIKVARPRTDVQVMLRNANNLRKKMPVTLAGQSLEPKVEVDERTEAEDRMIEAVKTAVELLTHHIIAMSQIPNPNVKYKNRVSQLALIDIVGRLARSVQPHINTTFNEEMSHPRQKLVHVCIDCGGPATTIKFTHWYCDDCEP